LKKLSRGIEHRERQALKSLKNIKFAKQTQFSKQTLCFSFREASEYVKISQNQGEISAKYGEIRQYHHRKSRPRSS
jgi:hypothetical protein